jgi:hypothetical protein
MVFVARKETTCVICGAHIAIGAPIRPLEGKQWACRGCIDKDDERTPVCKHWLRRGCCTLGEECTFRHPEHVRCSEPRAGMQRKKRPTVYNEGRAAVLRRWLLDTFGSDYLRSGSGVLDVAGGKGDLAFQLWNLNNILATLVEPRPMDMYSGLRMLRFGFYHRNPHFAKYVERPACICEGARKCFCEDCGVCVKAPNHIRGFFEDINTATGLPKMMESEQTFHEALRTARQSVWDHKGLHCQHEHEGDGGDDEEQGCEANEQEIDGNYRQIEQAKDEQDDAGEQATEERTAGIEATTDESKVAENRDGDGRIIDSYETALHILRNCSLIVGMHPDQAAEPIIDFALANNKPFAVVPCCVYSRCFPKRVDENGDPVRTYDQFIRYLMSKNESVHCIQLDFEGKNLLLYSLRGFS